MPSFTPWEFNWLCLHIFTARMVNFLFLPPANEVWGKVIFSQASVCPRAGEGVSLTETPPDRDPPLHGKKRAVRILLECILILD